MLLPTSSITLAETCSEERGSSPRKTLLAGAGKPSLTTPRPPPPASPNPRGGGRLRVGVGAASPGKEQNRRAGRRERERRVDITISPSPSASATYPLRRKRGAKGMEPQYSGEPPQKLRSLRLFPSRLTARRRRWKRRGGPL